jgi:hypothetical protein
MDYNQARSLIGQIFGIIAIVCGVILALKLGGVNRVGGGIVEWAAATIAFAQLR